MFFTDGREIYSNYTDIVESFGFDECWLDVSGSLHLFGGGKKIADEIRERIKIELGVTVSIGVSFNKVFSKLEVFVEVNVKFDTLGNRFHFQYL